MAKKLPAMQFYVGDWRKDTGVQALGLHDRGAWFEVLCLMHESEDRGKLVLNGKAISDPIIAQLLSIDEATWKQTRSTLEAFAVASIDPTTGALMCRRMCRDEASRQAKAKAGAKGGKKSRPPKAKQARSKPEAKEGSSVSSSSSVSPSGIKDIPVLPSVEQGGKPPERDDSELTPQQLLVRQVLDIYPRVDPGLAARWIGEWNKRGHATEKLLTALRRMMDDGLATEGPDYVTKVLRNALRNRGGDYRMKRGGDRDGGVEARRRAAGATPEALAESFD